MVITEIGGTVGDIESQPFLEAIRQVNFEIGSENVMYIHVTLVPVCLTPRAKNKAYPAQHKGIRSIGIQPNVIVCRTAHPLSKEIKEKIGLFCNIPENGLFKILTPSISMKFLLCWKKKD